MIDHNITLVQKIKKLKAKTRDRDIRIKLELFLLAMKLRNVSEACARRGFGRTFFYKWWNRFKKSKYKLSSLEEKSRRPKRSPLKTNRYWEDKILEFKERGYGAAMIRAILIREKGIKFSTSTINHIFNRRLKLKGKTPKKRLNPRNKRYELYVPGQRLQLDVKYVPKRIADKRIFNYVIVDECTRWRFSKAYPELNSHYTLEFLDDLLENCPFPIHEIQTDNGFEFTNIFTSKKDNHPMDLWCKQQNIKHRLIPPGAKELNGKVERSHRIDEQYFYWKAPYNSLEAFNEALKEWLKNYNEYRPHMSLGWMTPIEKLKERVMNLALEKFKGEQEYLRVDFLMKAPKMILEKYGRYQVKLAA